MSRVPVIDAIYLSSKLFREEIDYYLMIFKIKKIGNQNAMLLPS